MQGDIIKIYSASGTQVAEYVYDAWGNVIFATGTMANINPLRYRGYYYDADTGLYYLQSRYYDPVTGRFINADDMSNLGADGELNGYNLYAYCGNNPVMYQDDTGHSASRLERLLIGAGAVLVGAAITALTAGTGSGFMAAFGAALLTSIKSVAVSTAISAGIGFTIAGLTANTWDGAFNGLIDGAVDGFMWGGIFAGGAQILSGGFKVLAKAGVSYNKQSFIKVFTPNRLRSTNEICKIAKKGQTYYEYGGTLFKVGKNMLDVSNKTFLHLHLSFTGSLHIPIGTILSGIIGGF